MFWLVVGYVLIGFVIMVFLRRCENKYLPIYEQAGMNSEFWACVIFWLLLAIFVIVANIVEILESLVFVNPKE